MTRIEGIKESLAKAREVYSNGELSDNGFAVSPYAMLNILDDMQYLLDCLAQNPERKRL